MKKKLTALILNATKSLKMINNKWKYTFGGCNIFVDENIMEIYDIVWTTGGHFTHEIITPDVVKSLEETYIELGLSKNGNTIRRINYE